MYLIFILKHTHIAVFSLKNIVCDSFFTMASKQLEKGN